jgi:hypothetical protein
MENVVSSILRRGRRHLSSARALVYTLPEAVTRRAPHARLNYLPFAYRRKVEVSLLLFLKVIVSKDF